MSSARVIRAYIPHCVLFFQLASTPVVADAPLEPPTALHHTCSLNGRWCLEGQADPVTRGVWSIRVFERRTAGHSRLDRVVSIQVVGSPAVTNDGACVIDFATGSNLIALDRTPNDPAFTFYCKGSPAKTLSLSKFITNFEALPLSTSHRIWAESFGLDENDHLVVRTAEGRDYVIDPHTGDLVHGYYAH
jgi:hypothetical protein